MELTVDQALHKAVNAHKAGQIQEADRLYTAILKVQSQHPDANHNMGVLAVGVGKVDQALPFFKKAVDARPANTQFWLSYITALSNLNRLEEAKSIMGQAKKNGAKGQLFDQLERELEAGKAVSPSRLENQDPPQTKLQPLIALYGRGELKNVLDEISELLKQFPNSVTLHNISGASFAGLGKLDLAISSYKKAIAIRPNFADAFNNMGNALRNQGKLEKAIEVFNKALLIKPDIAEFYNNLAHTLSDQGRLNEAISNYKKAIIIKPDYADAFNSMGNALKEQGRLNEAISNYKKAIIIKPDYADAFNNIGNAFKAQGKLEEAISSYKKAITIKPDFIGAFNNIGNSFKDQGKLEEAVESYNHALRIKPDYVDARTNLAIMLFESGKVKEATKLFAMDDSSKSQSYLLRCFYEQNEKSNFYNQLDYLINRDENNAILGSYIYRSHLRYGNNKPNPFCNDPLKYVLKTDLTKEYDFDNTFIKGAADILSDDKVQQKAQGHLINGIQTSGNLFTLRTSITEKIERIIRLELQKYWVSFKDSREGLIKSWPSDYSISGWLVSMRSGGELSAHIHEGSWVTGSIYINVPSKWKVDSGNLVVCLDDVKGNNNMKSIDVVTGSLCLFPSSLLHYTVPFESKESRIVLAFDVIPKLN